jgi:hypothetical protein
VDDIRWSYINISGVGSIEATEAFASVKKSTTKIRHFIFFFFLLIYGRSLGSNITVVGGLAMGSAAPQKPQTI